MNAGRRQGVPEARRGANAEDTGTTMASDNDTAGTAHGNGSATGRSVTVSDDGGSAGALIADRLAAYSAEFHGRRAGG